MSFRIPSGITTRSPRNISPSLTASSSLMLNYAWILAGTSCLDSGQPRCVTCFNICNVSSLSVHALSICKRSVLIGKCTTAFIAPKLSVPPLCGRYALESVFAIYISFPLWYTTSMSYCSMRRSIPCSLRGALCSGFFTIISCGL